MSLQIFYRIRSMIQPELKISNSGNRCLIVPYQGNDYTRAIADAERRFGVTDDASVTVIALPHGNEICQRNVNLSVKNDQ